MTRSYPDPDGNVWTVWEVRPGEHLDTGSTRRPYLPADMADGWLCFESGSGKRRLYPVPPQWLEKTDTELDGLCRAAEPVPGAPVAGD